MYEKAVNLLSEKKLDAMLVSDGYNMRYLSGFRGATGYLYISAGRRVLMTDSRYTTQARAEAGDFEVIEVSNTKGYGALIQEIAAAEQIGTLGFEDQHMIFADFKRLEAACAAVRWITLGDSLNLLRMIKTADEIEKLAQAEAIGDRAFAYILGELRPGATELQIAAKLEYFMKEQGAQSTSFDTIVASGLHSAMPHAIPSDKEIQDGDFVTMDFGCVWDGYCSDMTRTVVVGKASERQRALYQTVLEAQLKALDAIKPGMTGAQVDRVARAHIEAAGYGEYFGHGLGHSTGLFIHEEPRLSPKCHTVLEPGMIETVEPGIYLPEFGGVRIEDLVVVTADGYRNLTASPKELIEV